MLSGGQAAGGHNVVMGLFDMIKKLHSDSRLFGFLNGPHGIYTNNYIEITADYMALFRNTGGFDMISKSKCSKIFLLTTSLNRARDLFQTRRYLIIL